MREFLGFLILCLSSIWALPISDERVASICGSLPTDEQMANYVDFYQLTGCNKNSNNVHCRKPDDFDVSVLVGPIKCLATACANDATKKADVTSCLGKLQLTFQNLFEFTPTNLEDQLKATCKCDYNTRTATSADVIQYADGVSRPVTVCQMNKMANCGLNDMACINGPMIVEEFGYCEALAANDQEAMDLAFNKTKEFSERNRIIKYCEGDLKNMLEREQIVLDKCTLHTEYKAKLTTACGDKCFLKAKYIERGTDLVQRMFYSGEDSDSAFDVACKRWNTDADIGAVVVEDDATEGNGGWSYVSGDDDDGEEEVEEEAVVDTRPFHLDYWTNTVGFIGQKKSWLMVIDLCHQFREDGEITARGLQCSPFPKDFWNETHVADHLDTCCKGLDYYETLDKANLFSLDGSEETRCFKSSGMLMDAGFGNGLIRTLIQTKTKQCMNIMDEKIACKENRRQKMVQCDGRKQCDQMSLTDGGVISVDNIFWFLRYLEAPSQTNELAWALRGCSRGAKLGKVASTSPGMALGLEAQDQTMGSGSIVADKMKTIYFTSFWTCGTFAAMEANNWFLPKADGTYECNPNVLDPKIKGETLCRQDP